MTAPVTKQELLEQLLSDICYLSHKHEVHYWRNAPGTDEEKLKNIQTLAREALFILKHGTVADIQDCLTRQGYTVPGG